MNEKAQKRRRMVWQSGDITVERPDIEMAFSANQPRWPKGSGDKSGQWRDDGLSLDTPLPRRVSAARAKKRPLNIPVPPAHVKRQPLPGKKRIGPEDIGLDSLKFRTGSGRKSRSAAMQKMLGPSSKPGSDTIRRFRAHKEEIRKRELQVQAQKKIHDVMKDRRDRAVRIADALLVDLHRRPTSEMERKHDELLAGRGKNDFGHTDVQVAHLLRGELTKRAAKRQEAEEAAFWQKWDNLGDPATTGNIGDTRVIQNRVTGQKAIWKRSPSVTEAQNEVLAYEFAQAIGARVPKVELLDEKTVRMDFVEGETGIAWSSGVGQDEFDNWLLSEDNDALSLLDYAIGNTDRHHGNYMVGTDGKGWAIDHGFGFGYSGLGDDYVFTSFSHPAERPHMTMEKIDNAINALETSGLREKMAGMGRETDYIDAMFRLNKVKSRMVERSWDDGSVQVRKLRTIQPPNTAERGERDLDELAKLMKLGPGRLDTKKRRRAKSLIKKQGLEDVFPLFRTQ